MVKSLRTETLRLAVVNPVPAILMFAILLVVVVTIDAQVSDPVVERISLASVVTCVVRLMAMVMTRRALRSATITRQELDVYELAFGLTYLLFAATLGALGAKLLSLPQPGLHALTLTMLVGYAAGVAATLDLKPKIAVPSILLATCPATLMALATPDMTQVAIGVVLACFIVGGCHTIIQRTLYASDTIRQRNAYRDQSRRDALTGLLNRTALREQFERTRTDQSAPLIAIHYLDLNGFKQVNDQYGHDAGDRLLREVAARLARVISPSDVIARLGGDEFVVLQGDIHEDTDAQGLQHQIRLAMLSPFSCDGAALAISASIGSAVGDPNVTSLDDLLRKADIDQYREKKANARFKLRTGPRHNI